MKKIINILLSFFMAVIIFAFGCCFTTTIITSAPYIKAVASISSYTKNAETEIAEVLESVAIPSGLPQDFFNDKIHTDFIIKTIRQSVESAISGKEYTMPKEEIEELVFKDLLNYTKENGIETNDEDLKMLHNTAELSATYYKNYTYNIFYRALKLLKGISIKMLIATVILAITLAFMYYLLKGKKELTFAVLGGAVMLILPIILIITGAAFKWAIASEALLVFVNLYIGIALGIIVLLGVLTLILGIRKAKEFIK